MNIQENVSLKNHNTFGIDAKAKYFVSVTTEAELKEALGLKQYPEKFILGGGSNMLLKNDVDALVIHIALEGITVIDESATSVTVQVCAGENWHEFVLFCIRNDYGGVENLSLIPGNTGTAPVQNIGAYGVELKDVFVSCEAIDRNTLEKKEFSLKDCEFGYRDSIFKNEGKNRYVITSVKFHLTKKNHSINIAYGAIQDVLREKNIVDPTIEDVSNAVIQIRASKLPNPKEIGNSGSFFKNPVITQEMFATLRKNYPEAPYYPVGRNEIKVPAGWLIEQAGFKGKRFGDAGVHNKQALVLVNYGDATGEEIWDLALKIQAEVEDKFGIKITPEVNIIT